MNEIPGGQRGFTLLWSKILDSSVWMQSEETRLVWITMLAMKDSEGRVFASPSALIHRARVEPAKGFEAIEVLSSPDPESMTKDHQGKRILPITGGWQIVNHELYRFSTEAKREFWRDQKQKQREREAAQNGKLQLKRSKDLKGQRTYDRTGIMPHEEGLA